ncbi:hypothetical protein AGMMS4952_20650 [Spirochaetia bacterium]|nr:hypothetical protein AGMMS4952_20540 [Spirochaetia bacterium]GHV31617.1 hypothetical protein AGMMS4952_20650 [Spirochaetia bacterium]
MDNANIGGKITKIPYIVDTETNSYYTIVKVPTSGRTGREQRRTVHDEFHRFI